MIDADERMKALAPPSVTIHGQLYVGQVLSWPQWLPWKDKLREWGTLTTTETVSRNVEAELRACLAAMSFPAEGIDAILGLPESVLVEVIADFFLCQLGRKPAPESTPTD
jgi:hypothetical protein